MNRLYDVDITGDDDIVHRHFNILFTQTRASLHCISPLNLEI